MEALLTRIDALEPRLKAHITILRDSALASAREAEGSIARGSHLGPLHGIPISLKDCFYTKGVRTTAGSKILADFVPKEDSTVVERLKRAGAIVMAKLNMSEFCSGGGAEENYHYGICRNPWDLDRIIVGSSRGSGSAVAAGLCTAAMGSDTGGSIRLPAALCGIVGLKPTYGRVSRFGVIPLSWSLDHVGPMARSVQDVALIMNAIAGYDPRDPSCSNVPVSNYTRVLDGQVKGLRLGIPKEFFFEVIDPEVQKAFKRAISLLEQLGASVQEVSIPHASYSPMFYPGICYPEVAAYHETWFRTRSDEYGPNIKGRIQQGMAVPAVAYVKAQRLRQVIKQEFREVFQKVDAIIAPTTPITAPMADATTIKMSGREHPARGIVGRNTPIFNACGAPALALPCGFSSEGMPISLQIATRPFDEETALRIGYGYEQQTDWHQRHPNL